MGYYDGKDLTIKEIADLLLPGQTIRVQGWFITKWDDTYPRDEASCEDPVLPAEE